MSVLLLTGVGVAAATLALWLGAWRSSHGPERFWVAAWCAAIASGALLLFAPPGPAGLLVAFLGPVFPAGQLAGALAFTRGRAAGWILPLALALGLARVVAMASGSEDLVRWIPLGVEPAGTLAAALLLYRGTRGPAMPWSLPMVVALLVMTCGVDLLTATTSVLTTGLSSALALVWVPLLVVAMPLQVHLAVNRDRHRLANLHYRTEAELEESQARFRALSESAFDLVAELDGDERFTYVNPRYGEVLGYARDELLGRSPLAFVHPDDLPVASRFADRASEADVAEGAVLRARRRDGSYVWLEHVARSFLAPDGRRRWVMNSRDVSDRVERERMRERDHAWLAQSVIESEDRFRALTDQAPELIAELDDRGQFTFANESFRELLGIDPKTLIGANAAQLIHSDDLPALRTGMGEAIRSEGTTRAQHRVLHADGGWRWFETTSRAYRTGNGSLRFVSIGRDVTEARLQERERRALESRMREVQRLDSLGALAGGIAHDFNNLLAVILGNVTFLEGLDPGEEARARLQRIRSAAAHAEGLTDQMLTYAGRSVTDLVPLGLSELVADTEGLLRATEADGIRLELDLAADLPGVCGDATQLRQVLLNLVANAMEALAASGRGRCVRVSTALRELDAAALEDGIGTSERPPGTWVQLQVSDDGPGMPSDVIGRIFEPFFSTKSTGRGLGLSAVLGIAGGHGGVLQIESAPGCGTTFRLLLRPSGDEAPAPLLRPSGDEAPAPLLRPSGDEAPAPRERCAERAQAERGARILVVDDDEAVREVAQLLLERGGYRVRTAAGGDEALSRLAEGDAVDAVLLDLEMPGPSGKELLRRLRQRRPGLPVVIASGYKRDLASDRLGRDETVGFVQKPYDPDALLAAIDDARRAIGTGGPSERPRS